VESSVGMRVMFGASRWLDASAVSGSAAAIVAEMAAATRLVLRKSIVVPWLLESAQLLMQGEIRRRCATDACGSHISGIFSWPASEDAAAA
jgi:hypothetical protein